MAFFVLVLGSGHHLRLGGGGGGIPQIARTQHVPPLNNREFYVPPFPSTSPAVNNDHSLILDKIGLRMLARSLCYTARSTCLIPFIIMRLKAK